MKRDAEYRHASAAFILAAPLKARVMEKSHYALHPLTLASPLDADQRRGGMRREGECLISTSMQAFSVCSGAVTERHNTTNTSPCLESLRLFMSGLDGR
ncbi:hypothetical protein AVEN_101234-1 [Araneus ventricosus]|uniref:Uncharacterized protein n=1 Tax=Araneus ventricosus TaxID=182803 RepID=A0A4Y2KSS8_ARAVE|nr:hypothetical protein AVEN_101234-1 [Araneus ventricosus]